jgi:hypothetical protein
MKIEKHTETQLAENGQKFIFMNLPVDLISYLLIFTVIIGSFKMYYQIDARMENLKTANSSYIFPTYLDLLPSLYYLLMLIILHKLFLHFTKEKIKQNLTPKYFEEGAEIQAEIYKVKVSTTFYKGFFFLFSSIFGYLIMKDLHFFPTMLFGDGKFKKLFEVGYPHFFYFDKPNYFDLYYNLNFAFALFDGYVLLTNPLQSDFLIMVLHHLVTYSLIVFSFISNYSSVGAVVYFIHYFGDIFSSIVRTSIHMNVSEIFKFISTTSFLVVFTYTRLFIYGDVIYQVIMTEFEWGVVDWSLVGFLWILMILNLLWIIMIFRKFVKYCITGNIEEIYKIKVDKIQKDKNN